MLWVASGVSRSVNKEYMQYPFCRQNIPTDSLARRLPYRLKTYNTKVQRYWDVESK